MHDSPLVQRQVDSASTHFMKQLGFEGVDVRHIKELDNTEYGSVIYDLKDSIKQTDTPEFKKWFGDKVVDDEGGTFGGGLSWDACKSF